MTARLVRGRWHEDGQRGPDLLAKKADMPKQPAPKLTLKKCRAIVKRTLAHALASNLSNMTEATFKDHPTKGRHGLVTITFDYPLKATKPMPKG